MSTTIDERVVEMRFDNKQFEAGASETMSTLQKLKKSLDFSNIGKSFENINIASNKVDMGGLDRAISGIHNKFSALEVMAVTTLANITNSIVNSAKNWASAFTIDPIKTGFQEYETQINAVQTILANTQKEGTNIKDVNAALDELNLYADKTIYNFTEMTRNIGTFTAAGVDLKTSVGAIQGIANLAAVSGSNSEQASTAMYQLSQALATGTVKLMDWNSVVNAGMGGQLFQDALKETSRLLGTGADAAIEAEGSFRESLKTGWLTSEVLTETLKKFTTSGAAEYVANYTGLSKEAIESELELAKSTYGEAEAIDKAAESLAKKSGKNKDEIADALKFAQTAEDAATKVKTFTQLIDTLKEALQSGWSQSFRIIIGDFEEAKKLFTEISDSFGAVISASSDARNKLLSEVFNKKDAQDYMASIVDAPKEAITELQTVAKEAGTTSKLFKDTLNEFTKGDEVLNNVMTHLIGMLSSEKDVVSYISDMTGMQEKSIEKLQNIGKEFGYTSNEFKDFVNVLAEGDPEMESTITHLLEMNDAMTKPSGRELLIDSLRNSIKGLVSVIEPVQKAFREVFPPATADQVYGILESFHEFTKTLILSEKNSQNLKNAFKGLFDIAKLLGDGFIGLVKLIIPVEKPINSIGDGILSLVGFIGSLLSSFSKSVRSSKTLEKAFYYLNDASKALMKALSKLINSGIIFIEKLSKMKGISKLIESVNNAFDRLYKKAAPNIDALSKNIDNFISYLLEFEGLDIDKSLNFISNAFEDLSLKINGFSFEVVENSFETLRIKIKEFKDTIMSNEGLSTFVKNFKEYGEELRTAFTLDNLLARLEKVMDVFGKFFNWIKSTLGPAFADFNIGTAAAGAGGLGLVYALIKMSKAFENISDVLGSIPDVLGGVKDTLEAYQKDLKASSMIKIAGAIAILAGALVLLSFADTDRLLEASIALALVSGVLMLGISKLLDAVNKGKELNGALTIFAKGLSKSMQDFGKAIKINAIGTAVKDLALSIAIIAASIIAMGVMYNKNPNAFSAALEMLKNIALVLVGIISLIAVGSKLGNAIGINSIGTSILMISLSLGLIVSSISKLMKMEFPKDYETKLKILGGIVGGMATLALLLAVAARIAGGNQLPKIAGTIKSLSVLLLATVISLKILFDMELPKDYGVKLGILGGIFIAFGALLIIMGAAAKIAGGNAIKAGGTIIAMAAFLAIVVGALFILTLIPSDKMLKGVIALGGILLTLSAALYGAGKITDESASKAVLAMAVTVGVIVAALAILSMIPWEKLLVSVTSLGVVLLAIAANFQALSKVKSKEALPAILGMIAATLAISYSLYVLSNQPWEGLLAAAAGLSLTLLALAGCFAIVTKVKVDPASIAAVVAGSASLLLIAAGISMLAKYDGQALLNSCLALSSMLLVITGVMAACAALSGVIGPALLGVLGLGAVIAELGAIIAAFGGLAQIPGLKWIIGEGGELLKQIGTAIGGFFGGILGGIVGGVMESVSSQLPKLGSSLSEFMVNLTPFIIGAKMIDASLLENVGRLSGVILALTAGSIIDGIANLFGLSLVDVATELSTFMVALTPFIMGSKLLTTESMDACSRLGSMILSLTGAELLAGIGEFLGIRGSLSAFGEELASLGPNIKEFADTVQDVKPEAVEGAAAAAEIMANVANKLPAQDGWVQKIFGEKSLAEFGEQLVDFGPSIVEFADTVKDVNPEAVEGAAAAAEIMANLADKLPSQGGFIAKIFGDKSLADFGAELTSFGPDIAKFSRQVQNVKPASVLGAASAAAIMSKLADGLPSSETLWNKIFGGGQISISEFGEELISFGESMSDFSDSITGIDTTQISKVVTSFKDLIDLVTYSDGASASSLVDISKQLGDVNVNNINDFVNDFGDSGIKAIQKLVSGINSKKPLALSTVKNLCTAMVNQLRTSLPQSITIKFGQNIIQGLIIGINSKKPSLFQTIRGLCALVITNFRNGLPDSTFKTLGTNIITAFRSNLTQSAFKEIGANAALGLKIGIESKINEVAKAAAKAAKESVDAAKKELDEKSPSKVMREVGEYFSIGLANGINDQIKIISIAGTKAADEAIEPVKKAVNSIKSIIDSGDFDTDPVIKPVMDLSNVQNGVREIGSLMNKTYDLSSVYNRAMDVSSSFNATRKTRTAEGSTSYKTGEGDTFEFIQNNYSPKALSRSEIYRQTNNQFSQFKRAVKLI